MTGALAGKAAPPFNHVTDPRPRQDKDKRPQDDDDRDRQPATTAT